MVLESDHVPPEVIQSLLSMKAEPSWSGLHRAAHAELEREQGPRFEETVLNDVVAVARSKDDNREPFPPNFDSLVTAINRAAKKVPHR